MKIENKNKYKELYLPQILSLLKKELKAKKIAWSDETNAVDTIQFNLSYK
jgi:bifunctional N-acetylglucosamine-1-phosphate-uridyltransferase/glucosamine-1-phosphate-acetyltransferase GlmU-like protein